MQIGNIRSFELADGEAITDVESVEVLDNGALKVVRKLYNVSRIPVREISYLPPHAWKRIVLDLHTLVIRASEREDETLVGITRAQIKEAVFGKLIADGVADGNARAYAEKVARGDDDLRHAGNSNYIFQIF
ncbi:hypothetical protein [Mycobacteroides chelonae]|uniref:hypothetical protein n=1 Tax=Mycobacteroides chelonae TaxID=1774 RepID=UPI0018B0A8F2|nr:hypothetical protein [Mycobacteroides chelonae]MBF9328501.1 hypothetical protein [Mycobacteroides chelonae]MBF9422679.1 hypothetical protein [Mycobacteroides chelonae]